MPRWHRQHDHEQPGWRRWPSWTWLPPLNFIIIHYAYFIIICLAMSLVFWGSSNPAQTISYTDSLFLVVSAMTEAGLNTVNLSRMTTWQQVILFLLIIFGSSVWVSIWTVVARKHVFEKRFEDIVRAERRRRASRPLSATSLRRLQRLLSFRRLSTIAPPQIPRGAAPEGERSEPPKTPPASQQFASDRPDASDASSHEIDATLAGLGASIERPVTPPRIVFVDSPRPNQGATFTGAEHQPEERETTIRHRNGREDTVSHEKDEFDVGRLLARRAGGRNAQFHGLTTEERERLGGCEYQALRVLSLIVPLYFVLWQLLGCLALGAWISNNQPEPPLKNGINPWWLGVFNGVSAFNNSGMSLLDANMIPFQESYFVLITMGLLILAGNTAYPVFLRLIVWSLLKLLAWATSEDELSGLKDTFMFILQYPRRVYTNLFPARPTWWLVFMLILLNSIDWVAFELLNVGNPAMEQIPPNSRVLDGLFQALAVRSGGFYVVPIPSVYIGLQVLYVVMMYISVYPVVITMRHSNVYEERSLGIYDEDVNMPDDADPELATSFSSPPARRRRGTSNGIVATLSLAISKTFTFHGVGAKPPDPLPPPNHNHHRGPEQHFRTINFISQQVHGQLAHDIWWLVLAILVIMTIETANFLADPVNFSAFNVIFEVVSAYGCVGISVGVPHDAFSFSGSWHAASKVVLCAVMLRGRHRGLPVALDRAVRLPGEALHRDEEEDHRIRRSLTNRRASADAY
ncbi:TrkH-domain-containing protein [Parathielavia appendiculata]|uniref:Potassium transport protein n=1 Tax=Parathielavia appendiculata TaxID=2587402 RepID=A0AAN6Z3T6_9PEZI|nr:TrkH-domain-containing protein [Parathielavia appendiculata]